MKLRPQGQHFFVDIKPGMMVRIRTLRSGFLNPEEGKRSGSVMSILTEVLAGHGSYLRGYL